MAIAVIDCGTNTFHLLIADISDDSFKILFRKNLAVKLGEGGISSNKIAREAFNRGIDALKEFAADMKQFVIDKQLCYATEAIRRATNGNDFVEDAKKQSGITLEIIDGLREAELIYSGVSHAVPFGKEKVLIMDIGGGSTEFVIAGNGNILWRQSFPLGAALLLDMFKPSDPIHDVQVKLITEHINSVLLPLAEALKQHGNVNTLVGSAGSFWYDHQISPAQDFTHHTEDQVMYGPLCMNIDVMRQSANLPLLNRGDKVVVHKVGAYNMTQWM